MKLVSFQTKKYFFKSEQQRKNSFQRIKNVLNFMTPEKNIFEPCLTFMINGKTSSKYKINVTKYFSRNLRIIEYECYINLFQVFGSRYLFAYLDRFDGRVVSDPDFAVD